MVGEAYSTASGDGLVCRAPRRQLEEPLTQNGARLDL
jgi:hypothetical protein